jgi:hypothetical protein
MSMQADGFEQRLQHVYSGWLRDGDTVIDVGAHTGRHAVPMAACVGHTGQVQAFEPNPRIFPVLQQRVSALGLSNVIPVDHVVKLDELAAESVRFIKIDTEGAEFNVILGAKETIARLRPVVSFQFGENSYRAYDLDPGAVHRFFGQLNYGIFSIFGDTLDEKTFVRHSREQLYWEYIACPSVHRAAMQSIMRSYRSRA